MTTPANGHFQQLFANIIERMQGKPTSDPDHGSAIALHTKTAGLAIRALRRQENPPPLSPRLLHHCGRAGPKK